MPRKKQQSTLSAQTLPSPEGSKSDQGNNKTSTSTEVSQPKLQAPIPEVKAETFSVSLSTPVFKRVTSLLTYFGEEAKFLTSSQGTVYRMMDIDHVVMLEIKLDEAKSKSDIYWNIKTEELKKIKARIKDVSTQVKLTVVKEVTNIHRPDILGNTKISVIEGQQTKVFETPIYETVYKTEPVPKITYTTTFSITKEELKDILEDIMVKSGYVTIQIKDNVISFEGRGDQGKASRTFTRAIGKEDVRTTYSAVKLYPFIKALETEAPITLSLSHRMPLRIQAAFGDYGHITYHLAPRVDDPENEKVIP